MGWHSSGVFQDWFPGAVSGPVQSGWYYYYGNFPRPDLLGSGDFKGAKEKKELVSLRCFADLEECSPPSAPSPSWRLRSQSALESAAASGCKFAFATGPCVSPIRSRDLTLGDQRKQQTQASPRLNG